MDVMQKMIAEMESNKMEAFEQGYRFKLTVISPEENVYRVGVGEADAMIYFSIDGLADIYESGVVSRLSAEEFAEGMKNVLIEHINLRRQEKQEEMEGRTDESKMS